MRKKGGKKQLWILIAYLHLFFSNFEARILAANPLLYFKVVCTVYVAETPI